MSYTNVGLVAHVTRAALDNWKYVYATYGQRITPAIIDRCADKYSERFKKTYSSGKTYKQITEEHALSPTEIYRGADCIGLFKSYLWWQGDDKNPRYSSSEDRSADGMYSYALSLKNKNGPISTLPEIPGILVRFPGHVGIYIGNGWVIEAIGANLNKVGDAYYSGVVKTPLKGARTTAWTHWYYAPFISYVGEEEKSFKPTKVLKRGDKGLDVLWVQEKLDEIGKYDLGAKPTDRSFGPLVEAAIKLFQKEYGITVNGQANKQTVKLLDDWRYERPAVTIKRGDKGVGTRWIQIQLISLGYDLKPDGADGSYGPNTEKIVSAFQKDYAIPVSGVADIKTIGILAHPVKPPVVAKPTKPVAKGAKGPEVIWIQERLEALKYDLDKYGIDGSYGGVTERAIQAFQKDYGLSVTGIADLATIAMLDNPVKPSKPKNPYPAPSATTTLRRGSRGESVKWVQFILASLKLYSGTIDGSYGPATEAAVRVFQQRELIQVDGISGPITKQRLTIYNT